VTILAVSLFAAALCAVCRISGRADHTSALLAALHVTQQIAAHEKIARRQPRRNRPPSKIAQQNKKASRE
jgi:hypothetical protein